MESTVSQLAYKCPELKQFGKVRNIMPVQTYTYITCTLTAFVFVLLIQVVDGFRNLFLCL